MRTALVTGGNRGIGEGVCRQLAGEGLRVVLCARRLAEAEEAAARLAEMGEIVAAECDVSDPESISALSERLHAEGIHVDVLINNAGVYLDAPMLDGLINDYLESLKVNVAGPFMLCRAFLPGMIESGYGRVVNVSSGYGSFDDGLQGPPAYSATKAALNALTLCLSREVHQRAPEADIKINAVCPGWVRTRMGGENATRSVEQGAGSVCWAALLPAEGPTGGFFRDGARINW